MTGIPLHPEPGWLLVNLGEALPRLDGPLGDVNSKDTDDAERITAERLIDRARATHPEEFAEYLAGVLAKLDAARERGDIPAKARSTGIELLEAVPAALYRALAEEIGALIGANLDPALPLDLEPDQLTVFGQVQAPPQVRAQSAVRPLRRDLAADAARDR